MKISDSKEFSLGGERNHCFNLFIRTMHTSKSSKKYLFVSFDNLDLRCFSSHMISQFGLKPTLSTYSFILDCRSIGLERDC